MTRTVLLAVIAFFIATLDPGEAALAQEQPGALQDDREIVLPAADYLAYALATQGPEEVVRTYDGLTQAAQRDPEVTLVMAVALQRLDQPGQAEALLRDALARQPDAVRLRLEYARLLYERGQLAAADFQFRLASGARGVGPAERAVARRYLQEIDSARDWVFTASLALAPDSNINQATRADTVELFGLSFRLDEGAQARSGVGVEAGLVAERRLATPLGRLTLSAGGRRTVYDVERFNSSLAVTGVALTRERWELSGNFARRWIGAEALLDVYGGAVTRAFSFTPRLAGDITVSVRQVDNFLATGRSGQLYGVGASVRRAAQSAGFSTLSLDVRRFDAAVKSQSYALAGVAASAYREIPGGLGLFAEATVSYRLHDAGSFFFPEAREDVSTGLRMRAVKRDRVLFNAFPYVELAGERTWSNQTLNDTQRVYGRFGLTRTF